MDRVMKSRPPSGGASKLSEERSYELAPICLFVYNRPAETRLTIEALSGNTLAADSDLFIFSDFSKSPDHQPGVDAVRSLLANVSGFRTVTVTYREKNFGLAQSIISGVTEIIGKYGRVIVLEDDLITAPNFLHFMNQALDIYALKDKVFAISGYSPPAILKHSGDAYIGTRSSSWGWATWSDRWQLVDWDVKDYSSFTPTHRSSFSSYSGPDLVDMLDRQMSGRVNSWMVRWLYCQFKHRKVDVSPSVSKVKNVGFGAAATHTTCTDRRFRVPLDNSLKKAFEFPESLELSQKEKANSRWRMSIIRRAYYKLTDIIMMPETFSENISQIKDWVRRRM